MREASSLKPGAYIRLGKDLFSVAEAAFHSGAGRAGATVNLKLRNVANGHVSERKLDPAEKVDELEVTRARMQLLFKEGDAFTFMDAQSFEQVPIPRHAVGPAAAFLKENDECEVEFFEGKALAVLYPKTVELRVETTGAGSKGHGDSTQKEATLENGLALLVPHFIKEGDRVRVDVETGKYVDRVSERQAKGQRFTTSAPAPRPEAPRPADPRPTAKPDKPVA